MTAKQFQKLKEDIEIKMVELEKLQEKHKKETGANYCPPYYLTTPKHLEGV